MKTDASAASAAMESKERAVRRATDRARRGWRFKAVEIPLTYEVLDVPDALVVVEVLAEARYDAISSWFLRDWTAAHHKGFRPGCALAPQPMVPLRCDGPEVPTDG